MRKSDLWGRISIGHMESEMFSETELGIGNEWAKKESKEILQIMVWYNICENMKGMI